MRIGLIGYGAVAAVHIKGLQNWGADVRTVFGPDAGKARAYAATHGVSHWTTSLDDLLIDCDAAIVASPSGQHFEQASAVLRAGRHCLVELPACSSSNEADTLSALAKHARVTLQCAHTTRFLPPVVRLEKWVKNGRLGDVRHVVSMRAIPPRRRSWTDHAVLHHAAHHVDLLLHWLDGLEPVGCVAHPGIDHPQDASLIARLPNGAPVSVSVSYTSRLEETRLTVVGSDHTITTNGFSFVESDVPELAWRGDAQASYEIAIEAQDRAFLEACSGGHDGVIWQDTLRLAECLDVFCRIAGERS